MTLDNLIFFQNIMLIIMLRPDHGEVKSDPVHEVVMYSCLKALKMNFNFLISLVFYYEP